MKTKGELFEEVDEKYGIRTTAIFHFNPNEELTDEERNAECRRRNAIAKAYLAGKALGVDLVKVVEG